MFFAFSEIVLLLKCYSRAFVVKVIGNLIQSGAEHFSSHEKSSSQLVLIKTDTQYSRSKKKKNLKNNSNFIIQIARLFK